MKMMRLYLVFLFLSVLGLSFLICGIRTQDIGDIGQAIKGTRNNFAKAARDDGLLCDDADSFGC